MPGHDLIVIGGSAGSVEALCTLVAGLPPELPAAVCVVVHQPAYAPSRLPSILGTAGALPVVSAREGAPLRPGTVHVAIPDHHLLVRRADAGPDSIGTLRVTHGPRENRTRPAVDPLFRAAALEFGPRVIGVVLSGSLDDGTAGLWAVRDRGGLAVVQDPATATVPSMPSSALAEAGADHVVSIQEMAALLAELTRAPAGPAEAPAQPSLEFEREVAQAFMDERTHLESDRYGAPSRFVCPDCGGVLWDVSNGGVGPLRFRCETGHAYSPAALAETQTDVVESALWASLRALENKAELARARADRATLRGLASLAERYTAQWEAAQQHAAAVRALLRMDGRVGMQSGDG